MINPNVSMAVFTVLAAYYVAECAWRLWRKKPTKYASAFGESILAIAIFLVMLATPAPADALHVGAKVFIVAGFTVATILRLIARKRFAAES
jgi:hypothetical protein